MSERPGVPSSPNYQAPFDTRSPGGWESREHQLDYPPDAPLSFTCIKASDGVIIYIRPRSENGRGRRTTAFRAYHYSAKTPDSSSIASNPKAALRMATHVGDCANNNQLSAQTIHDTATGQVPGWYILVGLNGQGVESDPLPPVKSPAGSDTVVGASTYSNYYPLRPVLPPGSIGF